VRRIVRELGLTVGRYHAWQRRATARALADAASGSRQREQVLAEERAAVLAYALTHPKDGYRRLAWQMIDDDVAYLSPSTVYRLLQDADLLARWKRSTPLGADVALEYVSTSDRSSSRLRYAGVWYDSTVFAQPPQLEKERRYRAPCSTVAMGGAMAGGAGGG
jgi:hypothetical protein